MEYSRYFGSNFPNDLIAVGSKKDVDDAVKSLVIQYYDYMDAGNMSAANQLYADNYDVLKDYIIDMGYINYLEEEIYNIALAILKRFPVVFGESEPAELAQDGYWYQDY